MRDRGARQMRRFREAVQRANLRDVWFYGNEFTWYNGRDGDVVVWECLDRYLVNIAWQMAFPQAWVHHDLSSYSNHSPICFKLSTRIVEEEKK